jgi:lipopolysaccharide heptosyltransferase II
MNIFLSGKIRAYFNVIFWLVLTFTLAPYFYLRIFGKRRSREVSKILVIQNGKIGDLVCTTPIFRELKKKFPTAEITALIISKARGILDNNPRVDKLIIIDEYKSTAGKFRLLAKLRREKYDWAINILPDSFTDIISFWSLVPNRITTTYRYSGEIVGLLSILNNYRLEYKRHTPLTEHYLSLLKFIGIEEPSEEKELFIKPAEEEKASEFLRARNLDVDDLLIGISVTAGIKLKEWAPDKFAILADKLIKEKGAKIIFIGSADDRSSVEGVKKMMQNNSVNACGLFKLSELPALLKKLKLFISVDTGPLYLADALGVLVVDIVGPVDVDELYSLDKRSEIVQKKVYCVPCAHMFYVPRFCKEGHLRCFKEIAAQDVFDAAVRLINKFLL